MKNVYEITQRVVTDDDGLISAEIVRVKELDPTKRYAETQDNEEQEEED